MSTPIPLFDDLPTLTPEPTPQRRQRSNPPPPPPPEPELLLTAAEAAAVLKIGRSKLYELVARGAITSVKLDRCRRFRRSDLDRFIRALPAAASE